MATGEKTFTTNGRTANRREFIPLPSGEYDLKVLGDTVSIGKKPEPGKLPYVKVAFEAMNTAAVEGGKNRRIYHMLFLSLAPNKKNGKISVDMQDQITALAKSLGEEYSGGVVSTQQVTDTGEFIDVDILDPQAVSAWLKSKDGMILRARTKIRKGTKDYPEDQSVVDYFNDSDTPITAHNGSRTAAQGWA